MSEPRADTEIARLIRQRVPDWWETIRAEHVVRFSDPGDDYAGRYVEVDGRVQDTLVVDEMSDTTVGPTVIGYRDGMCVRAVVPHVSDHADRMRAINAAVAIGALPDENGEPHTVAVVMPCDGGTHPGRAQADAQLIAAAFAECQESTASFDTGWGHGDCPCRKTGVHRVHRCEHGTEWWERTAQDAATAPAHPGEGDGTGSGLVDAHRGAEGFRPYDPSVSATGDQISVWGDDRELCIIDVSNAEVLRDMLDDMIGSLGGKSLRQAERARIAAFIRSATPHYDGKIAALLNLIETDQMER